MHTGIPEEKRPDYFDRLQELIGCGRLELIQEDGKCRLVYLMNDAAESFLVFEEAVVTGFCDKKIMDNHAVLDLYKEGYILSVNQGGENAFTIRFRNMSFEIKLYDYGDIGHFWIEDDEDLRWLNYHILMLRDKMLYLGREAGTEEEAALASLADFEPLYFFPSVPIEFQQTCGAGAEEKKAAAQVMIELAAGDEKLVRQLEKYKQDPSLKQARKVARMMRKKEHFYVIETIIEQMRIQGSQYEKRKYEHQVNDEIKRAATRKDELQKEGYKVYWFWQEPFMIGKRDVPFYAQLMIVDLRGWKKKVWVEIYKVG